MGTGPWLALAGPAGTGKSTLGEILARRTGRSFVDLDGVAGPYYDEAGWSLDKLRERIAVVGRVAAETEWEPARAHAVTRAVAEHADAVLALGAGHTSYTDSAHLAQVRTALSQCDAVALILPSADRDIALRVLRERCVAGKGRDWIVEGHDFLAAWLDDPGTRRVATHTVHTEHDSPDDTVDRLLALIAK